MQKPGHRRKPHFSEILPPVMALMATLFGLATCTTDFSDHPTPTCGNGILDPGEDCDQQATNGVALCADLGYQGGAVRCNADCRFDLSECKTPCGNGVLDEGELCDDGNDDTSDGCPSGPNGNCRPAACGDGYVWIGHEQCDDGNTNDGDQCSSDCTLAACGDGRLDPGELCDDGNDETSDDCPSGPTGTCQPAQCGDGFLWADHEECDDGTANSNSTPDACRTDCSLPRCGDGVRDSGEECDDGNTSNDDGCKNDCSLPSCGDGHLDPGEECDNGAENSDIAPDACRTDCTSPRCGDSVVDSGEACDDGNDDTSDGCPSGPHGTCRPAGCGDGFLWIGHEVCDDGNTSDCDGCKGDCTRPDNLCGDMITECGEDCDEGGLDTPTCDQDCTAVTCGDGWWNPIAGEDCDDGNSVNNDGCSHCNKDFGWYCQGNPSVCASICGDGIIAGSEDCDPPGTTDSSSDGCASGYHKVRVCDQHCSWGPWGNCTQDQQ